MDDKTIRFMVRLKKKLVAEIRKECLSSYDVLKDMDKNGGVLSYEGVEIMRKAEVGIKRYYHGSIVPSKSSIQRVAAGLESFGMEKVPFTVGRTEEGFEFIKFDEASMFVEILKAHGL